MTEKRFKYSKTLQGEDEIWDSQDDVYFKVCGALEKLNTLHEENHQLQEEIKDYNDTLARLTEENQLIKLLANHRGKMVSFANSLIRDLPYTPNEKSQEMWYNFKDEMYQKWKKQRGIE